MTSRNPSVYAGSRALPIFSDNFACFSYWLCLFRASAGIIIKAGPVFVFVFLCAFLVLTFL